MSKNVTERLTGLLSVERQQLLANAGLVVVDRQELERLYILFHYSSQASLPWKYLAGVLGVDMHDLIGFAREMAHRGLSAMGERLNRKEASRA